MTTNNFINAGYKLISDTKRSLIMGTVSFIGVVVLIGVWIGLLGGHPSVEDFGWYLFIASILVSVSTSMMFSDLGSKKGKLTALMTPATASEKFWPRFIVSVIGSMLLAWAGFYILESVMILTGALMYGYWDSIPSASLALHGESAWAWIGLVGLFVLNEGIYMFGAILWPKKSFIKTTAVAMAVMITLSVTTGLLIKHFLNFMDGRMIIDNEELIKWLSGILLYGIGLGLGVATYFKFKRSHI